MNFIECLNTVQLHYKCDYFPPRIQTVFPQVAHTAKHSDKGAFDYAIHKDMDRPNCSSRQQQEIITANASVGT